jgi:hypothetical protein
MLGYGMNPVQAWASKILIGCKRSHETENQPSRMVFKNKMNKDGKSLKVEST